MTTATSFLKTTRQRKSSDIIEFKLAQRWEPEGVWKWLNTLASYLSVHSVNQVWNALELRPSDLEQKSLKSLHICLEKECFPCGEWESVCLIAAESEDSLQYPFLLTLECCSYLSVTIYQQTSIFSGHFKAKSRAERIRMESRLPMQAIRRSRATKELLRDAPATRSPTTAEATENQTPKAYLMGLTNIIFHFIISLRNVTA